MGLSASAACWAAATAAGAAVAGGAVASGGAATAAAATTPQACVLKDNTTQAFLNCLLWRRAYGHSGFAAETQQPTEEADDKAMEHFRQLGKQQRKPPNLRNVLTESFLKQAQEWTTTGAGMPVIYILGSGWDKVCDAIEVTLGYRYSLEHWMYQTLEASKASITTDIDQADFVYLPHCATGIFMHIVARDQLKEQKNDQAQLQSKRQRRGLPNRTTEWLRYEGNLPRKAVAEMNDKYLKLISQKAWAGAAEFRACYLRRSCRFLIVSIYGRHVWRGLSEMLDDKALWLTHAGLSSWLGEQEPGLFLEAPGRRRPPVGPGCRAACADHCVLEPPGALPEDVVMPWIVAFSWTSRAGLFAQRDVLAFYSGTDNSCSRAELARLFSPSFQAEMEGTAQAEERQRVLVFPATFKLRQEEWSELAFRSRLCIVPDGDSPNTGRLIEVITHGCVPLIISDRLQPPFHEIVDWPKIAFFVREASIPDLPDILRSLATPEGTRQVQAKHRFLEEAAHVFDYDRDVVGSMTLMSLRERALRFRGEAAEVGDGG